MRSVQIFEQAFTRNRCITDSNFVFSINLLFIILHLEFSYQDGVAHPQTIRTSGEATERLKIMVLKMKIRKSLQSAVKIYFEITTKKLFVASIFF